MVQAMDEGKYNLAKKIAKEKNFFPTEDPRGGSKSTTKKVRDIRLSSGERFTTAKQLANYLNVHVDVVNKAINESRYSRKLEKALDGRTFTVEGRLIEMDIPKPAVVMEHKEYGTKKFKYYAEANRFLGIDEATLSYNIPKEHNGWKITVYRRLK